MNLEAAIFDMDGLLIDSEPLWHKAEITVFATVDVHLTAEQCRETTGVRIDDVVRIRHREKPWHDKPLEQVEREIVAEVERLALSEGTAMPGVHELLAQLADANVRMAVASASPASMIAAVLDHLGIRHYFECVCSAADEPHGKPHPAVYLRTARELQVEPRHCIAFDDSVPGVQSAHAAGMTVIAVPDAHHFARPEFDVAAQKLRSLREFNPSAFLRLPQGA